VRSAEVMIGIIVPPMPRPITNSEPHSSQYDVSVTWVRPNKPIAISAIANGTIRPTGILSASMPAIGIVSIAPMPCGATSRPACSVDSPRTCRK
jgi:hypothetical protein